MENLNDIVFYTIDKSIKSYKQFAQKQLKDAGFTITVDQWLVLKAIEENNRVTQQQKNPPRRQGIKIKTHGRKILLN